MPGPNFADSTLCMHSDPSMLSQNSSNHTLKHLGHVTSGVGEFTLESMDCGTLQQRTIPLSIVYPTTSSSNVSMPPKIGTHSTTNSMPGLLPANNSNHHVFFIQPDANSNLINTNSVQNQPMLYVRQCEQQNSLTHLENTMCASNNHLHQHQNSQNVQQQPLCSLTDFYGMINANTNTFIAPIQSELNGSCGNLLNELDANCEQKSENCGKKHFFQLTNAGCTSNEQMLTEQLLHDLSMKEKNDGTSMSQNLLSGSLLSDQLLNQQILAGHILEPNSTHLLSCKHVQMLDRMSMGSACAEHSSSSDLNLTMAKAEFDLQSLENVPGTSGNMNSNGSVSKTVSLFFNL